MSSRKHVLVKYTPLNPTFTYRNGFAGVYLFFLFWLQNIDCGYSLEPPRRGSSNVYPQRVPTIYVLSKNKKNVEIFLLKIFIFYNFKNLCILHGCVFCNVYNVSFIMSNCVIHKPEDQWSCKRSPEIWDMRPQLILP